MVPCTVYDKEITQKVWTYEGIQIKYIKYFKIPGTYNFEKTGYALFRALDRCLNLNKYDIYHADAALPTGQAMMLASKKYGKKYVVHGHGLDVFLDVSYRNKRNCNKIVDASKKVYENASAIIGVSQKVIDNICERVPCRNKSFVVYNGVDTSLFYPQQHKNAKIEIVVVGNLIPLKGHRYALKALRLAENKYPGKFKMVIVGKGAEEEALKKYVQQLKLEQIVDFLGYVAYAEVAKIIRLSDIFLLPSFYEALGCVYLEAMASGIPTIGCSGNGIEEIIKNGEDGFLVKGKNEIEIFNVLESLIDNHVRNKVGMAAREKICSQYKWSDSAEALLRIYAYLDRNKQE